MLNEYKSVQYVFLQYINVWSIVLGMPFVYQLLVYF